MKTVDNSRTLEQLENDFWSNPEYDSYVVRTCHSMRKKPLNEVTIEELRLVIGQGFSLEYLIPMAIEVLKDNILAEGDLFEGDLLASTISTKTFDYWKVHKDKMRMIADLINQHQDTIDNSTLGTTRTFKRELELFKKIDG